MSRVLVVDDETALRDSIAMLLRARKFEVMCAASAADAITAQAKQAPAVAVIDLMLPDMTGVELLKKLRATDPALPCIMITAFGSIESAVDAMKSGAYDYLQKPFDNNDLILRIERALERRRLTTRVTELEEELSARSAFAGIVGRSRAIEATLRRLGKVARGDTSVLLVGETGTGKGLAALGLHRTSPRSGAPFVAVNCGAISTSTWESELFGHVKGAFTDAKTDHRGKFEQANGGTLFLDEIGELSLDLQVKLLRAIEDRQLVRLGGEQPIPIDIRIIAATNRDLERDVDQGRFRRDLFWRLNVFKVEMPPLRERLDDLPLLIDRQLSLINAECRTAISGVAAEVLTRFEAHDWPGNVRELTNALRHGAVMAETDVLQPEDLPDFLVMPSSGPIRTTLGSSLEEVLEQTERQLLEATVARFNGNRTAAAQALGITRKTLYNKLRTKKLD